MAQTLHLKTRADLVAVVPHLLGFSPEDSLVCVPTHSGGPTARVDHPHDAGALTDAVDALADAYRRHSSECRSLAILAFTDHPDDAREATATLAAALSQTQRIELTLQVSGDTWTDLRTGETGDIDLSTRDRISAELVGRGRAMPKGSRHDLARALQGDPTALEPLVPAEIARINQLTADDLADEGGWLRHTLTLFERDPAPPPDARAARIIAALHHPGLRDLAVAHHTHDNAETISALWRDLIRRSPQEHVAPVAEELAFSAWLSGNGAEAWVAIDLIDNRPQHEVAGCVTTALQIAAPPSIWKQRQHARDHAPHPSHGEPHPDTEPRHRPHPPGPNP